MGKYGSCHSPTSSHSPLTGLYLLQDKWAYHLTSKVSPSSDSLLAPSSFSSLYPPSLNHSRSFVVLNKEVSERRGIGKIIKLLSRIKFITLDLKY